MSVPLRPVAIAIVSLSEIATQERYPAGAGQGNFHVEPPSIEYAALRVLLVEST